jgi:RNA polymerase sigma-70 factor (ECF subfamily)
LQHLGPKQPNPIDQATEPLDRARRGGDEELGLLLELYRPYLLAVAARELDPKLSGKAGASDLVQDTFVIAHRRFAEFRGETPPEFQAWLRMILIHVIEDWHRRFFGTTMRRVTRERPLDGADSREFLWKLVAERSECPATEMSRQDQARQLQEALAALPEAYRTVIQWRYFEGLSYARIAERVGRTTKAVKMLAYRAINQLAKDLKEHDETDSSRR